MNNVRKISEDLYWIGASDRRLALFENVMPIPRGVSYNSYILKDEKNVLIDTADASVSDQFFENLYHVIKEDEKLDYLLVNHVEPDHSSLICRVAYEYPEAKIICSMQASKFIQQFFPCIGQDRFVTVKEGDKMSFGKHEFTFVNAPMVHWPEVIVSYDITTKTLFSADAFGTFGALNGNIFADEVNFDRDWIDDARRYFTNIVGKYGVQVQMLLKKASGLEINMICPLHGPIWRENLGYFIGKYDKWSRYEAEDDNIMVVYGSLYGHTESAANIVASKLAEKGQKNIVVYDASVTHVSYLLSEAFRCRRIVILSPTYNAEVYTPVESFIHELKLHNLQNRVFALVENGTWAPVSAKLMRELLSFNNNCVIDSTVTIKSALHENQLDEVNKLVEELLSK
ncbi:MAG: FprA family A-type flavoprotein [Bacteroidales bacterium]|nr:FprA family A-type flavoprotein [Bacteroidales bacterium]